MASLVLNVDLSGRKLISRWTDGLQVIDNDTGKEVVPSSFMERVKYLSKVMLVGEPRWEWFPVLLARVSMGLFFAISGWNKLFTVAHWKGLLAGMIATGLPFPKLMALFLAWFEFVGGSLLTVGFMSTFFSIGLAFAMLVAIITVEIPFVIPPGLGPLDWLDWFLYLPQVLYVLIFLWLIIKGPGPYSADAVIARKLGFDETPDEDSSVDSEKSTSKDSETKPGEHPDEFGPIGSGGTSWTPHHA
jgi:putative oxidoreductase